LGGKNGVTLGPTKVGKETEALLLPSLSFRGGKGIVKCPSVGTSMGFDPRKGEEKEKKREARGFNAMGPTAEMRGENTGERPVPEKTS